GIVQALAFDPNGERLASGGNGGVLKIWDLKSRACKEITQAHVDICSLAFSNDGRRLVSGGSDNLIKIWDAETGLLCQTLKGHTCNVASVQFTDDDSRIVSASGCDHSLRIWDAFTGETILIFHDTPACNSAIMAPGSQQLAGAMADGTVRIWDARPLTLEIQI